MDTIDNMPQKIDHCNGDFYPDCVCTGKNYEPGSVFNYSIYVTPGTPCEGGALYVLLEYDPKVITPILEKFIAEDLMPSGMFLYVYPGMLPHTLPEGSDRVMRPEEFDQYGGEFANLLIEELIPQAEKITGITVSQSPDLRMITGGSSGGLCAWNVVWFRNDSFRRAFLSSPTFSAMRGGEEPMVLARKTETRPMRLYVTVGTNEPDYFFGSSFYAACNAKRVLEFANYDFRFELFPGEGHCCRRSDPALLRRVITYLWRNWRTEKVCAPDNQIRIKKLLAEYSQWEEISGDMPAKMTILRTRQGDYSFCGSEIRCTVNGLTRAVADGFGEISGIAISSDLWRLYVADKRRRFIYALSIQPDGSLTHLYKLASLHLAHDCRTIGAMDLCVGSDDRVLAATELGIQGVISFGMTDLILPLPGDLPAERVSLVGNQLYASSGERVFRRSLKITAAKNDACILPPSPDYGDGFDYSISHLPQ